MEDASNRFLIKKAINACGLATADFRLARNHRELVVAHKALGFPGVLKLQFSAPGEPGPWIVRDFDDVPPVLKVTAGRPLVWERLVAYDRELAVHATRSSGGIFAVDAGSADAADDPVLAQARDEAKTIGDRLAIVGPYCASFFQGPDGLIVDEVRLGSN
jgi:5-(carboxyamino)imidazole ribonucleotide synthase